MITANLDLNKEYRYEDILEMIRSGKYSCATIKNAAGKEFPLIGFSEEQLNFINESAVISSAGLIINGSRVVGPRTHQRTLHPVLKEAISLAATGRAASVNHPPISHVTIRKDVIKEFGIDSPHTSDLSVLIVHPDKDSRSTAALSLAQKFDRIGCSFPIRVFDGLYGRSFSSEAEYIDFGCRHFLLRDLPHNHGFSLPQLREGFRHLYATINLG